MPFSEISALLRTDLESFIYKSLGTVDPAAKILPNWHVEVMADVLHRVFERKIKRLIITVPPRSLKSISVSVAFAAWALGRDPSLRMICASYAQDLASKLGRDCRLVMQADWYKRAFPRTKLNPSKSSEAEFETTMQGSRLATSVGGVLTGLGGNFLIIDDPIKPQDAYSDVIRNRCKEWFDSTLLSRLNNKENDCIVLVMQRLHVDDLVGHLLERGDGWMHLNLPAIAQEDEAFTLRDGRIVGRKSGVLLHPAREPQTVLDELQASLGPHFFSAQYLQQPIPAKGNILKWDWFQRYSPEMLATSAGDRTIVQSWDTAFTSGTSSDWSVCTTWEIRGQFFYLRHIYRARLQFPELKQKVAELKKEWRPSAVLVEDVSAGKALIQQLREDGVYTTPIQPDGSKIERAHACSSKLAAGRVFIPANAPFVDVLRNEVLSFPYGKHDDLVDSITQFLNWHKPPQKIVKPQWR